MTEIGESLGLVILSRPQVAGRWMEHVREHAPNAAIVYDTVDLHWVREARRLGIDLEAGEALPPKAAAKRELELAMIRASEATIVVTEDERRRVLEEVPDAQVHVLPNVNPVRERVPPPERRSGRRCSWAASSTTPTSTALWSWSARSCRWSGSVLPDVPVRIVGSDPPPEIEALAGPRVGVEGWVADLDSLIDTSAALVAPLRYGAGLKGKVTQALAAGLPVVTTPIGAEGLAAVDGEQLLIGTTPQELADRVVRVLADAELWRALSRNGQALAAAQCSPALMTERLSELLTLAPRRPTARLQGVQAR